MAEPDNQIADRSRRRASLASCAAGLVTTLVVVPVALAAVGTGDFAEPASSPEAAGELRLGLATDDFDGDDIPDLAVANRDSDDVTILLGEGDGDFAEAATSPEDAGDTPTSVAVGDFDADAVPDLAVTNFESDQVTILLGEGDGDFTEAATSPEIDAGDGPRGLAAGDFDGDAIPDLAVTAVGVGAALDDVTILLGQGDGDFTAAATSPEVVGDSPTSVVAGDLDADNVLDLAVANLITDDVTILLGQGDGDFTEAAASPHALGDGPIDLILGDVDADGVLDLAITNSNSNNVTILIGQGNGDFTEAATSPEVTGRFPGSIGIGDFNGDMAPDLTTANRNTDNVTILLGQGDGDFTEPTTSPEAAGDDPTSVGIDDFNGDDVLDLAVANQHGSEDVTVLLGRQQGPDLTLTKSDSADPVLVSGGLTYKLEVTNNGPNGATDVVLTDTLPAALTYDDPASDPRCEETAPGVVECALGAIDSGDNDEAVIAVKAIAPADPATNQAEVSAAETDTNPADNSASEQTTIRPVADLTLTKSDSADPVLVSGGLTYKLEVTNNGPNGATDVVLTDTLPAALTYDDPASDPRCEETAPGVVECALGAIDSGDNDEAVIAVKAIAPADPATNQAEVSAAETDTNPADNSASEQTTIRPVADLTLTKSDSADPVLVSGGLTYKLEVTNNGPNGATDVVLTDTLPAALTYDDPASDPRCEETAPGVVECALGAIDSGDNDEAVIAVKAIAPADPATNQAEVSAAETDTNPADNSASEQTTIGIRPTCDGEPATIVGTDGEDALVGTNGSDVIVGLAGDDLIRGLDGDDLICGQDGDDLILAGAGDDTARGGSGADELRGGSGADELAAFRGDDLVGGGRMSDRIRGGSGNDELHGHRGSDRIGGGRGDDAIGGGSGDDVINGGPEIDGCRGGDGDDHKLGCEHR